ncbi:hypothetical protein, partial [Lactococcus petauri]|uniref:hypothetical protein n=1 Tax=Lactococcus petauri TaxID=1940789 RepID=UPI0021F14E18
TASCRPALILLATVAALTGCGSDERMVPDDSPLAEGRAECPDLLPEVRRLEGEGDPTGFDLNDVRDVEEVADHQPEGKEVE